MVDHRRVDLEHRLRADAPRGEDPFAAEVVVALDDHVGAELAREPATAPTPHPAQLRHAERRRHRDPAHAPRGKRTVAGRHEHVDVVPERREAFGDRRTCTDPPLVPGTV